MIIDDEYSQYEMFRIINKADADAIAAFEAEYEEAASPDARNDRLEYWESQAAYEKEHEESTEESVYSITYAEKMLECWKNRLYFG